MKWGDRLKEEGVLKTPEIIAAFNEVDRGDFIPKEYLPHLGQDRPIPIGHDQTNSAPTIVAQMLEWLEPKQGQKVLDIGAGSGWTTALLGRVVGKQGKVIGVERIENLVEFAGQNIKKYDQENTEVIKAGDKLGYEPEAPYDRILVSAATDEKHVSGILEQLSDEGLAVIPISDKEEKYWAGQTIVVYRKSKGKIEKDEHPGYIFVPLISD